MPVFFPHVLTERTENVVNELSEKANEIFHGTPYCRDNIYELIRDAKKCPADRLPTIKFNLQKMFMADGIEVSPDENIQYYEKKLQDSNIPDWEELTDISYRYFSDLIARHPYPRPEEYIGRYVDLKYETLEKAGTVDSKWRDQSLRLKLLREFIRDADGLSAAGYSFQYAKKYAREMITVSGSKNHKITNETIACNLDENVFLAMDELKAARDAALAASKAVPEGSAEEALRKRYKELHEQCKAQLRKNGVYGLLKLCDDLENGRFTTERTVREQLYLFAVTFGLSFSPVAGTENQKMSIEKLFADYYGNHLMRWITGHSKQIRGGGEVPDPTGSGVNYKNYFEVLFLYDLARSHPRETSAERLKKIYSAAKDVHSQYTSENHSAPSAAADYRTMKFEEMVKQYGKDAQSILLMDEGPFLNRVTATYNCSSDPGKTTVFDSETEQNSAVQNYCDLMDGYDDQMKDYDIAQLYNKDVRTDDSRIDREPVNIFGKKINMDETKRNLDRIDRGEITIDELDESKRFNILIYEIGREIGDVKSKEDVLEAGKVTRSDIIKLCYWIYLGDYSCQTASFPEVFYTFASFCNENLEPSFFPSMNSRNLYDLMVAYSVYVLVNQDLMEKKNESLY